MSKRINWDENPALEKNVVDLRNEGHTYQEIANQMGLSYKQVETKLTRLKAKGKQIELPPSSPIILPSKVKVSRYEINEIITTIGDNVLAKLKEHDFKAKNVKLLAKYSKAKKEEQSILDISDIHLGMVNKVFDSGTGTQRETYNYAIYLKELANLRKAVFGIHGLLSHAYNLKKLNVFLLGDIVTNDRIFSGQMFHIDRCVGEQIWDGVATLVQLIQELKTIYQIIEITCVVGNHGRTSESYKVDEPVENNFEYHLYRIIQLVFDKDPRVKVTVPNTRQYIVSVDGWRHLIQHGDTFRGSTRNYLDRQIKDLKLNIGNFDVLETAHVHSCRDDEIGENTLVKQNGCWVEKDNYALKVYKQYSIPKQHYYGCNRKRIETWSYKIDLRKIEQEHKIK